jgi:predicted ATPase
MRLTAIRAKNYRSFRTVELTLRPLTLLYGENNSGKSALLRLLPLILDSLVPGIPPGLNLSNEAFAGARLSELRMRRDAQERPDSDDDTWLGVGFTADMGDASLRVDYTFSIDGRISRLNISAGDASLRGRLTSGEDGYTFIDADGESIEAAVRFEGLCPASSPPSIALLTQLQSACRALGATSYRWLPARRPKLPRKLELRSTAPRSELEEVPFLLKRDDQIRGVVSEWYEENFQRLLSWRPENPQQDEFSLTLTPHGTSNDINLVDSGEGLSQVLPILTAEAQLRAATTPSFLAIEEPESNLHANKHEPLIALFTAHAAAHPDHTILLETHSRPALLTVLLKIAAHKLDLGDVALHWVAARADGSELKTAKLNEDGFITGGWPELAFEAEPKLAHRLIDAQGG